MRAILNTYERIKKTLKSSECKGKTKLEIDFYNVYRKFPTRFELKQVEWFLKRKKDKEED